MSRRRSGRTSAISVSATPRSSRHRDRTRRSEGPRRPRGPPGIILCSDIGTTYTADLDRRDERGRDRGEEGGDVGADGTEKRDRDDRDQAQDQRVLDERLALLTIEAGAQADEEALHRDHLLPTSLSDSGPGLRCRKTEPRSTPGRPR